LVQIISVESIFEMQAYCVTTNLLIEFRQHI